jgi:hypothetical protein
MDDFYTVGAREVASGTIRMSISLRVEGGQNIGQTFPLTDGSITIGRQAGNTIVLADGQLSRQHARLDVRGTEIIVIDLGSANGTRINDLLINGPTPLRPGDVLRMGDSTLRVETQWAADVATPPRRGRWPLILGGLSASLFLLCGCLFILVVLGRGGNSTPTTVAMAPTASAAVQPTSASAAPKAGVPTTIANTLPTPTVVAPPSSNRPIPTSNAPGSTTPIIAGKYGCTASHYNARTGAYEYLERGAVMLSAGGTYRYLGFEQPSTGSYRHDAGSGVLTFRGGYLDGGEATPIDRPNKFFLVFPTNPDNRWTCTLTE